MVLKQFKAGYTRFRNYAKDKVNSFKILMKLSKLDNKQNSLPYLLMPTVISSKVLTSTR